MNPTAVRRALYGKMSGDTTLNNLLATPPAGWNKSIWYNHAPDEAKYPFVLFNKQAGTPTYANAAKPAYETDIWLIEAVDGPDPGDATQTNTTADIAEAVSSRLNALLTDGSLSIAGGDAVMWLRRESDTDRQEITDGKTYVYSGSLYRLIFEPA